MLVQAWERGGSQVVVLSAPDEAAITAAQAAARGAAIPTHTFAGARGAAGGKARSLMVIGPAEEGALAPALAGLGALR
jgi:peptidyl-tRNA hydrolase